MNRFWHCPFWSSDPVWLPDRECVPIALGSIIYKFFLDYWCFVSEKKMKIKRMKVLPIVL